MHIETINAHNRVSFVRHSVKTTPTTDKIINAIIPYYPKDCICIAGFLDVNDQYWKINYHWELLLYMIDKFIAMPSISADLRGSANTIRAQMMSNPPHPVHGYRNDKNPGDTKDSSSHAIIESRHHVLKLAKKDFAQLIKLAKIVTASKESNPPNAEKAWWLSVAPVMFPGKSKHGTGYALDIAGNNEETKRISKALSATLVFNEASHVHVEWMNGVSMDGVKLSGK